jgi:Domain of unknown function (DUF4136)
MKTYIVSALICVLSISVHGQEFKTSTRKGIDLKKFETFTIVRGEVVTSEDSKVDKDQFYKDFVRIAMKELQAKGYTYVTDSVADLSLSYVVETSRVVESENVGPLGQMPQRNAGDVQTQTWSRDFTRGSLIISAEIGNSARGNNQVWSSEGTMDVARTRGGNVLEYAIKNALRDFPSKFEKEKKRKRNKKG